MRASSTHPAGQSPGAIPRSLQRRQPRLRYGGDIIPHLDQAQLNQRSQILVPHRHQSQPISMNVAKGPAKADGPFEVKICKRSFHPGGEMNDPPIGSAGDRSVGIGQLCKDAAAEL